MTHQDYTLFQQVADRCKVRCEVQSSIDGADENEPGCDAEMKARKDARLIAAVVNALDRLLADSAELERVRADAQQVVEFHLGRGHHAESDVNAAAIRILDGAK